MTRLLVCISVIGILGCAAPPAEPSGPWPSDVPSRRYYESAWACDGRNREFQSCPQYLGWVESFYAGSLLVPGWLRRQAELLRLLDGEQARLVEPDLTRLGQLLSSEWAKDNRVRRISSESLVLWGGVMSEACRQGKPLATLDSIARDARDLLGGRLEPPALTRDRYLGAATSKP